MKRRSLLLGLATVALVMASQLSGGLPTTVQIDPIGTARAQERCAFQSAYQSLPELASRVGAALDAAGIVEREVGTNAYGETCGSTFMAMESDIYVIVPVANQDDID